MNDHDVEALLRDSLRGHADRAPSAGLVVARVLARVEARSPRGHWRPWVLPLAAAAVVVIVSVALAIGHQRAATPPAAPIAPPSTAPVATHATATVGASPTVSSVVTSSAEPAVSSSGMPVATSSAATGSTSSAPTAAVVRPLGIRMVTATAGWALADAGLLYTDDGGATWVVRTPPTLDSPVLAGLDFEGDTAFSGPVEMWFAISGSQMVKVFHTTDAGRSWSSGSIPAIPAAGGSGGMISAAGVSFPTPQDGWLLANVNSLGSVFNSEQVALYRTRDGGETWTLADAAMRGKDSPSGLTEHGLKTGIGFATPERGWITGFVGGDTTPWMYQTADGGGTWTRMSLPTPADVSVDQSAITDPPLFLDDEHGVFPLSWPTPDGGSVTTFYVTDDGGETWRSAAPLQWLGGPWLWAWPEAAHAMVVNGLNWCVTSTSGASWQCDRLPAELEGVTELSFVTAQRGWAVADDGLLRTTDGGSTWSRVDARLGR